MAGDTEPGALVEAWLWWAFVAFGLQAALHWCRAFCGTAAGEPRAQQHEVLSGAATGMCAVLYQAMAFGCSRRTYAGCGNGDDGNAAGVRVMYDLHFGGRALAGAIVLVNLAALARERRTVAVALAALWCSETVALYLGGLVPARRRGAILLTACSLLVPLAGMTLSVMGGRLRRSPLEAVFRFLAMWCTTCAACYALVFYLGEVVCLLTVETQLVAYVLLDGALISVSSCVVSSAGPDLRVPLLPAQEAELSLYPGPHHHGFYPNPEFYDDNL